MKLPRFCPPRHTLYSPGYTGTTKFVRVRSEGDVVLCRLLRFVVNPVLKRRGKTVLLVWRSRAAP